MSGELLTLDVLLAELDSRGIRVELGPDGSPSLAGKTSKATPALLAVLKWRRQEVIGRLRSATPAAETPAPPAQEVVVRPRQWLWRDGHTYAETPDNEWLFGNADRHPVGSWWWRYQGEAGWRVIEGRAHVAVYGADAVRGGAGLPPGEHLAGDLPRPPGPAPLAFAVAGPQGQPAGGLLGGVPEVRGSGESGAENE